MIGIVGGAGPLAGVDIVKKIIEETEARTDQDHVPVMLLSIPQSTPDRTEYLLGVEKNNPAFPISRLFLHLERAGATVAAIPCNTAHADPIFSVVRQELQKVSSQLKLISMIQENVSYILKKFPSKRVGVLSTTGTRKMGIYRNAFASANIPIIEPPEGEWQERIHRTIYDPVYGIKTFSSPVKAKAKEELYAAMDQLKEQGAEVIVLGCTEIPLAIMEDHYQDIPLIDPNRILARALIRETAPEKLRQ